MYHARPKLLAKSLPKNRKDAPVLDQIPKSLRRSTHSEQSHDRKACLKKASHRSKSAWPQMPPSYRVPHRKAAPPSDKSKPLSVARRSHGQFAGQGSTASRPDHSRNSPNQRQAPSAPLPRQEAKAKKKVRQPTPR